MSATWSKICGITRLQDGLDAQAAGASAVGFNCYPGSSRYAAPALVAEISAALQLTRVALFVNAPATAIEAVLNIAEIDLLQFHGDEPAAFCESFGLPYVKALRMQQGSDFPAFAQEHLGAWALLLDAYVPGQPGGTGQSFDWQDWPRDTSRRLILAGGLRPDNVAAAVAALRPFGVDVAGGVEDTTPGCKDLVKMRTFVQEVRRGGS